MIASNAPDIDIVAALRGGISYQAWHRGPTHGPLGIVGLGVVAAGLVWIWLRTLDRRTPEGAHARASESEEVASFGMLVVASVIGVLVHVLMDFPTSYGTRLLSPFDWHWFAVDWMPIVDFYLLVALAAGLMFGRLSAASSRRNAAIVFALMAAYYGVRGVAHHEALASVPVFGPTLPQRAIRRRRPPVSSTLATAAMPPPLDPSGIDVSSKSRRSRISLAVSLAGDRAAVERVDSRHRSSGGRFRV